MDLRATMMRQPTNTKSKLIEPNQLLQFGLYKKSQNNLKFFNLDLICIDLYHQDERHFI